MASACFVGVGSDVRHRRGPWHLTGMLTCALVVALAGPARGEFVFVEDGTPRAAVVLPETDAPVAEAAAAELISFVERAAGVTLPTVREGASVEAAQPRRIYVGPTRALREVGTDLDGFEPDEFEVFVDDARLFLAGKDEIVNPQDEVDDLTFGLGSRGTYHAVIHLIETHLGGGFLWPGDLGTVYPDVTTLATEIERHRFAPPIVQRRMRNAAVNSNRYLRPARDLGVSEDHIAERQAQSNEWLLRRKLGTSTRFRAGHSFTDWWARYGEAHPEWFAMFPDGHRGPIEHAPMKQFRNANNVKLCVSNPDIIEPIVEYAREFYEQNPHVETLPMAINDGRIHGFCMCEACKAWDDTQAGERTILYAAPDDGERYSIRYHYLTDRYARFWRRVSDAITEEFPDAKMLVYAYGVLEAAPVSETPPENLVVSFVANEGFYAFEDTRQATLKRWADWTESPVELVFRPNFHYYARGFPLVYVSRLSEDIPYLQRSGAIGVDFDILHHSWGTQGINNYVLARLLWDPAQSGEALVDEFCEKAFGDAAEPMQRYFTWLDEQMYAMADREGRMPGALWRREFSRRLVRDLDEALSYFEQARAAVPEGSREAERIAFFREGLRFVELMDEAFRASHAYANGDGDRERHEATAEAVQAYLEGHLESWVIDSAYVVQGSSERTITGMFRPEQRVIEQTLEIE